MAHEDDFPASASAEAEREPDRRAGPRPDFLSRAERILRGDVRPEDYLPVTPEVESRVARDFAFATEHVRKRVEAGRLPAGSAFEPNARFDGVGLTAAARQRNQWLLSLHHGGQNIAYIEDENGVIVLAVGLEEGGALIDAFPYELRKGVGFGAPPLPDVVEIY